MKKLVSSTILILLFSGFTHAQEISSATALSNSALGQSVVIQVKGMVCDFCARGIEKVFRKKKEVSNLSIDLKEKIITIDLLPNASITNEEIKTLIIDNGIGVESLERKAKKEESPSK